jgi:hypothetical protein
MRAGVALLVLVLVAYVAPRRGLPGGCALVAAGLIWLAANKSMEGRTIIPITPHHGFTVADLAGVAAILLGARQVWRGLPRRRR